MSSLALELGEKCGIFGVAGHPKAASLCYYGLFALQHRGQESAGISVSDGHRLVTKKGMGLVSEVFSLKDLEDMTGPLAIGHVRYSTTGESVPQNAQPLAVKLWRGEFAVAHNGNLVNATEQRTLLESQGSIFQTTLDTEVIPHLMARSKEPEPDKAFAEVLSKLRGAFALVALHPRMLLAARDPMGIRPLCFGKLDGAIVVASETCALDSVGASIVGEIEPGEILISEGTSFSKSRFSEKKPQRLCAFEFIYFARPDSDIAGLNVHRARKLLGRKLARSHPADADLVTGVPDSSLSAASGYAEELGIPYEMGLVKNRYVGRTFIAPEQSLRELAVKLKLNPLKSILKGKRVVLVDDSIVRGTTSRHIVGLLKSAGAREVHVRISSPPYRFPCYYGIDTSSTGQLAAARMPVEEIRKEIGATTLAYLGIEDLEEVLSSAGGLCLSCFTGDYPAGTPATGPVEPIS